MARFILMIWLLGFLIGMPLFIFLYLKFQAKESWTVTSIGTVVAAVFIIRLFDRCMHTCHGRSRRYQAWAYRDCRLHKPSR